MKYLFLVLAPPAAVFVSSHEHHESVAWASIRCAEHAGAAAHNHDVFSERLCDYPFYVVQALGRPELKAILDLLTIPVYVALAWLLMRRAGIDGAAWQNCSSQSPMGSSCIFLRLS